jgi:hypothetical protein
MNQTELDTIYTELCRALTEIGEDRATLLLARFALLAMGEIDDIETVRALLVRAKAAARNDPGSTRIG